MELAGMPDHRLTLSCVASENRHTFGLNGGTFGRSRKCAWVLPDPDCILSLVHGRVVVVNGDYVLIDESTNGIFVQNIAEPLGRGGSVILQDGMKLTAGNYQIQVELMAGSAPDHQMPRTRPYNTDPPEIAVTPVTTLRQSPATSFAGTMPEQIPVDGNVSLDPLHFLTDQQPLSPQPCSTDVLSACDQQAHAAYSPDVRMQSRDDFGPASEPPHVPGIQIDRGNTSAVDAHGSTDSGLDLLPGQEIIPKQFLDQSGAISGISAGSAATIVDTSPSGSALSNSENIAVAPRQLASDEVACKPNIASTPTPQLEGTQPVPLRNRLHDNNGSAFGSPLRVEQTVMEKPVSADRSGGHPDSDHQSNIGRALKARRGQHQATLQQKNQIHMSFPPLKLPDSRASSVRSMESAMSPSEVLQAETGSGPTDQKLVAALLNGLGLGDAKLPPDDHEKLLYTVGSMVRQTATGLIALLSARKLVKSTFRLDDTQPQPEENNAFKFFMVGELALDEMLLTRKGEYQPAEKATKEAFDDIQYHTLITISALHRALRLLFEKMDPKNIGQENGSDGGAHGLRLGSQTGKWQAYEENYEKMERNLDLVIRGIASEAFTQVQEERARKDAGDRSEDMRA